MSGSVSLAYGGRVPFPDVDEPVFYFRGDVCEVEASWCAFLGWIEWMDVEDGEYADMFDASGAPIRLWVERLSRPRGVVRRTLRCRAKVEDLIFASREPPTLASRRALAARLTRSIEHSQDFGGHMSRTLTGLVIDDDEDR